MSLSDIKIKSNIHDYKASFISDINEKLMEYEDCFSIVDKKVYSLYKNKVFFPTKDKRILLEANENTKSFKNLDIILRTLIKKGIKRNSNIIVIGGGTIQDSASFIASVIYRGVSWIFFPTTLLAQCDSCIGSKTSINFEKYKNQIGTFYPADKIFIDINFLQSLSKEDILSGIGEIIKIYYIEGNHILQLQDALKEKNFEKLIYNSLIFKKKFIEIDEFDKKERNILNYGHTLGHALETLTNYNIPHGQSVLLGADFANYASNKMGYITNQKYLDMRKIMKNYLPKYDVKNINTDDIIDIFKKDKKNVANKLSYILTSGYGKMFKLQIDYNLIEKYLEDYIKQMC